MRTGRALAAPGAGVAFGLLTAARSGLFAPLRIPPYESAKLRCADRD
jgi:hypothetical protein